MKGSNQTSRAIIRGGANTGRFDRGEDVPNAGDVTLRDPVSQGTDRDARALWRRHAQRRQRLGATTSPSPVGAHGL